MARIFLDANYFIDLLEKRRDIDLSLFEGKTLLLSPLTAHIAHYVLKARVPSEKINAYLDFFSYVPLEAKIATSSQLGPQPDFEDNLQLHSAAAAECDIFLTQDRELLKLKFFGKTRIVAKLS